MVDKEHTMKEKKSREKSAAYPAVSISQCYDFIKMVDSLGGKAVSYASVLDAMGLSSPTTKSFLYRVSASKQFNFITTGGSTIQLTDLAKRILYPNNGEEESQKLLIEAFKNPPLYEKLIARFDGRAIPLQSQLGNILMNEYRIIKQVKDNAAKCFIESADFLGLLRNGVLCMNENEESASDTSDSAQQEEPSEENSFISDKEEQVSAKDEGYFFEIPTMGKKTAKFYIPDGVTEKDIDYIKMYVEHMLPVFLDNLKEEL